MFNKFVELGGQGIQGALAMNCGPTAQLIASLVEKPETIYSNLHKSLVYIILKKKSKIQSKLR